MKKIFIALFAIALLVAFRSLGPEEYLSFAYLTANADSLRSIIASDLNMYIPVFFFAYVLVAAFHKWRRS